MALDRTVISELINEMNQKLAGGKVDKIHQTKHDKLIISVRTSNVILNGFEVLFACPKNTKTCHRIVVKDRIIFIKTKTKC